MAFNGLSVAEIERRSRALPDRTDDPLTWRCRSSSGFLGDDERLADVIGDDARLVAQLGSSHEAMAELLAGVVARCAALDEAERRTPQRRFEHGGQALLVHCCPYMSPQHSLFWNDERPDSPDNRRWSVDYRVANAALPGCELCVGGDHRAGVIDWIRRYGFYEGGGGANPYRLDPALVLAVLTGRLTGPALAAFRLRKQAELAAVDREERELVEAGAPASYIADRGFAARRQLIAQQQQHWQRRFDQQNACVVLAFVGCVGVVLVVLHWLSWKQQ